MQEGPASGQPRSRVFRRLHFRPRFLPGGLLSERNVVLSLVLASLGALAATIAHGQIFTAFIYELFGDNKSVGLVESASGMVSFLSALPVGFAVDAFPRTKLLRVSSWLGLMAAVLGAAAVALGPSAAHDPITGERRRPGMVFQCILLLSLALWGVFTNMWTSASAALFADSVPEGLTRRELFATKSTITLTTLSAGPLIALCCTTWLGNHWNIQHMVWMILPGFAVVVPMCFLTSAFEEVGLPVASTDAGRSGAVQEKLEQEKQQQRSQQNRNLARPGAWLVPYLLMAGEIVTAIGAGMTVKFFGLWFKNDHKFSPAALSALQAATPLSIMFAVQALQGVAKRSPGGPVPAVLAFWVGSIITLLAMAQVKDVRILTVLHLVRAALANCKEPIAKAILADFIPSERRGRWNAAHSISSVTWTGSAALGGILCDRYGYGRTFILTSGLYVAAALCWLPLMYWVRGESAEEQGVPVAQASKVAKGSSEEEVLVKEKAKGA
mmetsp:Transcript_67377/g.161582  ORF Transcript_67377/g.161582 Transcript_67377/m.161582 type:complete len:498 (-) Transcript_67377:131-1624(-)